MNMSIATPSVFLSVDEPGLIENQTWNGCDSPHGAIVMSSGGGHVIRNVSMFNVPRAVMAYPNALQGGGQLRDVVIDGLLVKGHVPHDIPGTNTKNFNEALCFHGNGGRRGNNIGFQGWVRNVDASNVHVLDWKHEPLTLHNANFDNFLVTDWVSEADSPVKITLKEATTVNNVRIHDGLWRTKQVNWILVGPHSYKGSDIGHVEFPDGWTHSLQWWSGTIRRDYGTFDNVADLRLMLDEVGKKWTPEAA